MLSRLYVHNYRCLENFELDLTGHRTCLLMGKNGAGKSTVRKALEILQQMAAGMVKVGGLVGPGDYPHGRTAGMMRFEVTAELQQSVYQYGVAFEYPEGFRQLRVAEERLTRDGQTVYSRERQYVTLGASTEDETKRFGLDWHTPALAVIQERSPTDPLAVFRSWLSRTLVLDPVPTRMEGESSVDIRLPDVPVEQFAAWLTGTLLHAPATYTQISDYLREVMPDFREFENAPVGRDARSLSVTYARGTDATVLRFGALSSGEKCIFVGALTLAANRALGHHLCFWDEPDAHLDLSQVGHFIMRQRQEFERYGQAIYTSHNPEAIRAFTDDSTFLLFREDHLAPTRVRLLRDVPYDGDVVSALIRGDVEL